MKQDKSLSLLIGLTAGIILLAVVGLLLVQNPSAPLPWEKPTETSTPSPIPPTWTETATATSTGTRRPTRTPVPEPTTPAPTNTGLPTPSETSSPTPTLGTITLTPIGYIATSTATAAAVTASPSATSSGPTPTETLAPTGELVLVTGRVLNKGTPVPNITISLEGPAILTTTSDAQGRYQFQVNWMDEDYSVVFSLEENPQLSPASDYLLWSWVESYLEGNAEIPDIEISTAPDGNVFTQSSPVNGSSFSAAQITVDNPLTFEWTAFAQAEEYWVDLGLDGDVTSEWVSDTMTDRFVDFDGTLLNGTHITPGAYWWAVGTLRLEADFYIMTYTQTWTLSITP